MGGWAEPLSEARQKLPRWKWVLVRGRDLPQTCANGMLIPSWGDYLVEDCTHVGSIDYDNVNIVSESTCVEGHRVVDELIGEGIPAERIVIGGFSMGATAAGEVALRYRD